MRVTSPMSGGGCGAALAALLLLCACKTEVAEAEEPDLPPCAHDAPCASLDDPRGAWAIEEICAYGGRPFPDARGTLVFGGTKYSGVLHLDVDLGPGRVPYEDGYCRSHLYALGSDCVPVEGSEWCTCTSRRITDFWAEVGPHETHTNVTYVGRVFVCRGDVLTLADQAPSPWFTITLTPHAPAECAPCADGERCLVGSDCASGFCDYTPCLVDDCEFAVCGSSCVNGIADNGETDADCGGPCGPCGQGKDCVTDEDCADGLTCASQFCF